MYTALNVERLVTEGGTVQQLLGTKIEHHPFVGSRNPHFLHHKGDHLCLAFDSRLGTARTTSRRTSLLLGSRRKEMKTRMM